MPNLSALFGGVQKRNVNGFVKPFFGVLAAGWTDAGIVVLTGPGTGVSQLLELPPMHDGALLTAVTLTWAITTHSGVPATLPSLEIFRIQFGAGGGTVALNSAGAIQPPTPGSVAAWNASTGMTYTCNQNNTIDNATYLYYAQLTDENGTNALSGNSYQAFQTQFSVTAGAGFAFP
jgi:hypothetical protein